MKVTKDEIVAAARHLFREKGYAGASMQDLASLVGLRKASLYMRFPNKEALVPEVLALTLRDTFPDARLMTGPWQVAYEAAIRGIAANLSTGKRCVGLHLAYGVGDDTPVAKEAVREFFQSMRTFLSDILARAMPRETADIVAADALIRLEGATLLITVFDDTETMQRTARAVIKDATEAAWAAR
ncbi:TetR/AcrR family transcriptional regulator [Bosea sp. PAMC 26642]|uniref:TetR/AcrR family transcriptional regulator n=1 Tax=Bosea sp. (strain PAMC 26642) TaxID=1792307 RepID=UPI0007701DA9|nr:TetR/AcrR family transcriptional regulator [Bosea sp. PAMC 26642]AMJ59984.1 transcriptional regulator [Bosea sp. PAMC 26642]